MAITQTEIRRVQRGPKDWAFMVIPCLLCFWAGFAVHASFFTVPSVSPVERTPRHKLNEYETLVHGYYESAKPSGRLLLRTNGEYQLTINEPLKIERGKWTATDRDLTLTPSSGATSTRGYKFEQTQSSKTLIVGEVRYVQVIMPFD